MKRFLAVIALVLLLAAPSFALSNKEYGRLMSNPEFARADRRLNHVYNNLQKSVSKAVWTILKKEQSEWIKWGRDDAAKAYINEGHHRTKAYAMATNDRARRLPRRAEEIAREIRRRPHHSKRR